MKKRRAFWWLLAGAMFGAMAAAEIIPAQGIDQEFRAFTGIEAVEAVVLCESLTVREFPSAESKALDTLENGSIFMTSETVGCYINAMYADGSKEGWVRKEYAAADPAWYVTEETTPAYAWGGEGAPRVGLLEEGEKLPLLWENETHYVVGLRGASAWIEKHITREFSPETLGAIQSACLNRGGETKTLQEEKLLQLHSYLSHMEYIGSGGAGCPFHEEENITVLMDNGQTYRFLLALDACSTLREEHGDYRYSGDLLALFED